jgi:hypothetical protein
LGDDLTDFQQTRMDGVQPIRSSSVKGATSSPEDAIS